MSPFPHRISVCLAIVMSAFVAVSAMAQTAPVQQPARLAAPAPTAVAPASAAPAAAVHEHDLYPGLQVAITSLKRTPESTLTLRWDMINPTDQPIAMEEMRDQYEDMPDNLYKKVTLLDLTNRKKYTALSDAYGRHVGRAVKLVKDSGGSTENIVIPAKGKMSFWLKYPALPKEVQSVSVEINGVEPFSQVPITD